MKKIFGLCFLFVVSLHAQMNFQFVEHENIENTTWDCIVEGVRNIYSESTPIEEIERFTSLLKKVPRNVLIARENGRYVGHMFYTVADHQYVRMGMVGAADGSNKAAFVQLANQLLSVLEAQFSRTIICGCLSSQREKLLPLLFAAHFQEDSSIEQDPAEFTVYGVDITKDYHWFRRVKQ